MSATRCVLMLLAALGIALPDSARAAELYLTLNGPDRGPLADLVIVAVPASPIAADSIIARPAGPWVMDQLQMQFEPEVLVVPAGAVVSFPNSDAVAHQVYSFSPTRRFSLGLYRGKRYPPVDFTKPGLVVLGCNIHDSMVGYIYVAESPFFGKTTATGELHLAGLPAGTYAIKAWSSRFKGEDPEVLRQVSLKSDETLSVSLTVSRPLLPARPVHAHPKGMRY